MKNMDWDSIRVFLAVAEQGSLSAAAQVLLVSQPTIGRQISRLEDQLGLRLFDRRQTGYELTEEGKRLVTKLRQWHAEQPISNGRSILKNRLRRFRSAELR
ncbi:LysR family transcriptional regulator [Roseibium album]|uniref:LysR family transcriptional regulator n=1 Tax=Roseibium album TaxID=311410 RepID=UPI00391A0582